MSENQSEAKNVRSFSSLGWLVPAIPGLLIGAVLLAGFSYALKADLTPFSFVVPFLAGLGFVVAALRNFRGNNFSSVAKNWFLWLAAQAVSGYLLAVTLVPKSWHWPGWFGSAAFAGAGLVLTVFFRLFGWNKRVSSQPATNNNSEPDGGDSETEDAEGDSLPVDKVVARRAATIFQQFLVKSGVTNASELTNRVIDAEHMHQQQQLLYELNESKKQALAELEFALKNRQDYTPAQIEELRRRVHRFEQQAVPASPAVAGPRRFRASGGRHAPQR